MLKEAQKIVEEKSRTRRARLRQRIREFIRMSVTDVYSKTAKTVRLKDNE